jgi:hypothetical protein
MGARVENTEWRMLARTRLRARVAGTVEQWHKPCGTRLLLFH